ncbi:Transposon Tf2-12 polyprotein [Ceratobasidium theobromae]|uniref:Transposon Tf2-12 polyprotein n=1 Tax=Ceratobasidium theobromae TaxID=1582974 RepID=A0A5N5Q807_9AGAM|nr:Transposon Tf2-12 polyprotein [Ceratobasidium theobromae]
MAHRYLAGLGFTEDPTNASRAQTPFDPNEDTTYVPTPMPTNVNMPNVDVQIWELLQRLENKLDNVTEQVALLRTEIGEVDACAGRLEGQVQNLRQNTHASFQNLANTINPLSATVTLIHNSMQGGIQVGPVQAPPQVPTAQPGLAVAAPVPMALAGSMKLAKPEKFDGSKKEKAIDFKLACSSYININYAHHPDTNKIVFIMSYLEGAAHDWLWPFLEEQLSGNIPLALRSLPEFWAEFDKRFGDINRVENYRLKLQVLKQNKSVQDYLREFQTFSAPLGYGDLAKRDMFYDGLHNDIKEVMLVRGFRHADPQNSFANVANLALEIDISLDSFKPNRYSKNITPPTTTKITSLGGENTRAPSNTSNRQEKYSKGDAVYMIGSDGRAVKGKITNIG